MLGPFGVAVRTIGATPQTEQAAQHQAHADKESLHDGQRVPSGQLSSEHPGGYFQERVIFCGRFLDAPCYAQLLTCARPY